MRRASVVWGLTVGALDFSRYIRGIRQKRGRFHRPTRSDSSEKSVRRGNRTECVRDSGMREGGFSLRIIAKERIPTRLSIQFPDRKYGTFPCPQARRIVLRTIGEHHPCRSMTPMGAAVPTSRKTRKRTRVAKRRPRAGATTVATTTTTATIETIATTSLRAMRAIVAPTATIATTGRETNSTVSGAISPT